MAGLEEQEQQPQEQVQDQPLESVPAVDHTEDLQEIKDALQLMQDQAEQQAQQQAEMPEVITGIDQFLIDNGTLIVEVLGLVKWWLFIGVPLICIVSLFWITYKQFLYTKI